MESKLTVSKIPNDVDPKDLAQAKLAELMDEKTTGRFRLGTYMHYKGNLYTAYSVTVDEETQKLLVHYYSHTKKTRWTRTIDNFREIVKVEGKERVRFRFEREAHATAMLLACGLDWMANGVDALQRAFAFVNRTRDMPSSEP